MNTCQSKVPPSRLPRFAAATLRACLGEMRARGERGYIPTEQTTTKLLSFWLCPPASAPGPWRQEARRRPTSDNLHLRSLPRLPLPCSCHPERQGYPAPCPLAPDANDGHRRVGERAGRARGSRWPGEPLDGEGDASVALELSLPPLSPQEEGQNVPRSSHSVPTLHPSTLRHTTARRGMNTHTRAHTHAHTHTHFFGGRI